MSADRRDYILTKLKDYEMPDSASLPIEVVLPAGLEPYTGPKHRITEPMRKFGMSADGMGTA
jgi:hypothetical protein